MIMFRFLSTIIDRLRRPETTGPDDYVVYRDGYDDGYLRGYADGQAYGEHKAAAVTRPPMPSTGSPRCRCGHLEVGHWAILDNRACLIDHCKCASFRVSEPDTQDPLPLAPLGDSTNGYWFANGALAYYRGGQMFIHASANDHATVVPCVAFATIKAVASSVGLSDDEAIQLADAAERYGRVITLDEV